MTTFRKLYTSFLLLLATATDRELARIVRYLKEENRMLRARIQGPILVGPRERQRLLRFGRSLGRALRHAVTIVHPRTFLRWLQEERSEPKRKGKPRGRPKTPDEMRRLILKMARENNWGYTRIMGELKKLRIRPPSRNTIKNILKAKGLEPGPNRGEGSWDDFLKRHAATLWQCDFFSKRVLTWKGFRTLFVLVFLHIESRRVFVTPATYRKSESWVREQMSQFRIHAAEQKLPVAMLFHDHDHVFTRALDEELAQENIQVKLTAIRAPNTNAYVERFIQSIEQECLDHFVVFGEDHLNHLVSEYVEHYHTERPHQAKENGLLHGARKSRRGQANGEEREIGEQVVALERLGGLLKHYCRRAA